MTKYLQCGSKFSNTITTATIYNSNSKFCKKKVLWKDICNECQKLSIWSIMIYEKQQRKFYEQNCIWGINVHVFKGRKKNIMFDFSCHSVAVNFSYPFDVVVKSIIYRM